MLRRRNLGVYLVWDYGVKTGLLVAPTETKTYFVRYRPRNMGSSAPKRFVVLGRHGPLTPDEARARARTLLGAVAAGRIPPRRNLSLPRLYQLLD